MSKVGKLQAERTKITEFYDTLQQLVNRGEITREMAREIAQREYGGKTYAQLVEPIDEKIAQLQQQQPKNRRNIHVAALAMVFVLAFGFAWQSGNLTGLFTFSDEQFYNYEFAQSYTTDDITVLGIEGPISSLRMSGQVSGTGTADIWLQSGTDRYLVAHFDASEEQGLLTGFVTAVTDIVGTSGNASNETNTTGNVTLPAPEQDVPAEINTTVPVNGTANATNITAATNTTNVTVPVSTTETPETVPLTPSAPAETPPEESPATFASREFDNSCAESCSLQNSAAPFMLIIDVDGEAIVHVESLVYGMLPESPAENPAENPVEEPAVEPATPETDPAAPRPDTGVPQAPATLADGELCAQDTDCSSGICKADRHRGIAVAARCVPQPEYCTSPSSVVAPGATFGDSTCYAAAESSVWLASPGSGRYEVKSPAGAAVAVIDKYGNMAVAGSATFSSPAARSGWVMENKAGTATLSIDSAGNVIAAGSLLQNTRPTPTAGNDFIVKDASDAVQAVFTESGSVQLAGTFSSNAVLQ